MIGTVGRIHRQTKVGLTGGVGFGHSVADIPRTRNPGPICRSAHWSPIKAMRAFSLWTRGRPERASSSQPVGPCALKRFRQYGPARALRYPAIVPAWAAGIPGSSSIAWTILARCTRRTGAVRELTIHAIARLSSCVSYRRCSRPGTRPLRSHWPGDGLTRDQLPRKSFTRVEWPANSLSTGAAAVPK